MLAKHEESRKTPQLAREQRLMDGVVCAPTRRSQAFVLQVTMLCTQLQTHTERLQWTNQLVDDERETYLWATHTSIRAWFAARRADAAETSRDRPPSWAPHSRPAPRTRPWGGTRRARWRRTRLWRARRGPVAGRRSTSGTIRVQAVDRATTRRTRPQSTATSTTHDSQSLSVVVDVYISLFRVLMRKSEQIEKKKKLALFLVHYW